MVKPIFGIQLYTLMRHIQTAEGFDTTLGKLEEMGVRNVQISGIGDIPAATQKEILDKHSMSVCITHQDINDMLGDLPRLIEEHKLIGCDAIGLGAAPEENRISTAAVKDLIEKTEKIAKTLREQGMTFSYHNHDFDFKILPDSGRTMMDMFLNDANPELFNFVPDVAWMHYAGVNPAEFLKKLKGRVKVVHFKDYIIDESGNLRFVSLGQGVVNLKECYDVCCEMGYPYIVYEQDSGWVNDDAFLATQQSWEFLQSLKNRRILQWNS